MPKNSHTSNFYKMENTIKNFAWGSYNTIQNLLDIPNGDGLPQAELWMGAHPNGCSRILISDQKILLSDFINVDKSSILSSETNLNFGELPYLFKVLAAEKALSIQVHPSKVEAKEGFDKEALSDVLVEDPLRNYRDANHKPELVYALTSFTAMNGFRQCSEIIRLLNLIDSFSVKKIIYSISELSEPKKLESIFKQLLSLNGNDKSNTIDALLLLTDEKREDSLFRLVYELSVQYPGDIGLFGPLLLNVITLKPGEAMFLEARTPHAYIKGTGLEVMANSDNVLRAGLTSKNIDIDEVIKCTSFIPKPMKSLKLKPNFIDSELIYPIPVPDFKFSIISICNLKAIYMQSAEILLALDDEMTLFKDDVESVVIQKGRSVFIPASTKNYNVTSKGRIARVFN